MLRLPPTPCVLTKVKIAIETTPDDIRFHENLGALYSEQGQVSEAREQFQAILRIDPNNPSAKEGISAIEPVEPRKGP